jgi:TPR repeat protein
MSAHTPATPYPHLLQYRLYREALPGLLQSAEEGDARALSILGLFHALGVAGPRDLARAQRLMERSAALGDVHGQTSLGILLLTQALAGGSTEGAARGLRMLREAARAGSVHAQLAAQRVSPAGLCH